MIVGHDRVTAARSDVLCVQVDTTGTYTADLVTVSIEGIGAARSYTVGPISKTAFVETWRQPPLHRTEHGGVMPANGAASADRFQMV